MVICLWMGKTYMAKTPSGDLRSPLQRIHYYHNKRLQVQESQYLIPTYTWTLTPIPNWTCSVVTFSPFNAEYAWILIHDLHTNLRNMLATKFFSSLTCWRSQNSLVTKPNGAQTQQLLQEKDELGQILSPITICMNKTFLHTCATFYGPSK